MTGKSRVLRTVVRDCLYLNWALPVDTLPQLPEPLSYEEHLENGSRHAFASALLFRHEHLHMAGLPFLRFSYPQFNLRLYVRDHEGVPSVYFQRILVPGWVVPSARWVAHQPAQSAQFSYPQSLVATDDAVWNWEVVREVALRLSAKRAPPQLSRGPSLGSWNQTVDHFRHRSRGYVLSSGGLHPVETSQQSVPLLPLEVSVEDPELLIESLGLGDQANWPDIHSAWLCPEVPYEFELSTEAVRPSLRQTPASAAPGPAMFQSSSGGPGRPSA